MVARTVPAMPDFFAAQKLTATLMNQITTYSRFWANPPSFRMHQSGAQSIPNAAITVVTMDIPEHDSDSGRAIGTPWAYTIPPGMGGHWTFTVHIPLAAAAANERDVYLYRNGAPVVGSQFTANVAALTSESTTLTVFCSAGDVMAAAVFQQSGSAVNTFVGTNLMPTFEGVLKSLGSP